MSNYQKDELFCINKMGQMLTFTEMVLTNLLDFYVGIYVLPLCVGCSAEALF